MASSPRLDAELEGCRAGSAAKHHSASGAERRRDWLVARSGGVVTENDLPGLLSRPEREAANRLYQRLGFERRGTSVYRFK